MTQEERDKLFAEIRQPEAWARLHSIEQDIVTGLADRPIRTWCKGCEVMIRRLHQKATGGRKHG